MRQAEVARARAPRRAPPPASGPGRPKMRSAETRGHRRAARLRPPRRAPRRRAGGRGTSGARRGATARRSRRGSRPASTRARARSSSSDVGLHSTVTSSSSAHGEASRGRRASTRPSSRGVPEARRSAAEEDALDCAARRRTRRAARARAGRRRRTPAWSIVSALLRVADEVAVRALRQAPREVHVDAARAIRGSASIAASRPAVLLSVDCRIASRSVTFFALGRAPVMLQAEQLIERIRTYQPSVDSDLIQRAYDYSFQMHAGQTRKSGQPYVVHPVSVAGHHRRPAPRRGERVRRPPARRRRGHARDDRRHQQGVRRRGRRARRRRHQALEDQLHVQGGPPGGELPQDGGGDGAGHPRPPHQALRPPRQHADARAHEARGAGAHRPRDARDLRAAREPPRHPVVQERARGPRPSSTSSPTRTTTSSRRCTKTKKERDKYIADVCKTLSSRLAEQNFAAEVHGRAKHLYSVYRKMKAQQSGLEGVHDLIAFRVVVESVSDCYAALGVIHSQWTPVPGRFKDYIALPKPNMYQSLHTTVIGPGRERIEIQIRTHEMHRVAERGIAAHWKYKERGGGGHRRPGRAALRVAAAAARVAEGAQGPGRVPRGREGRPLPGRGLRLHAQGRRARLPARRDADRLRVPDPHAARRPRHRRAHQRQDRAAPLQAPERRRRRGADRARPAPEQGLARLRRARRARASKIRNYLRDRAARQEPAPRRGAPRARAPQGGHQREQAPQERRRDAARLRRRSRSRTIEELFVGIGYGKIDPEEVIKIVAPPDDEGRESKPPEQLREGRLAGLVRKVIKRDEGGDPHQRDRRRARALRQVLQPAAGRRHPRLHHARARRHHPPARLSEGVRHRSRAARRDHAGTARRASTAACSSAW